MEELWLREEGDGLGRVDSCIVFAPIILHPGGIVGCNGHLRGEQEMGNYIFIIQDLEQEDGRGNVGEKEEKYQVKDSHRGRTHVRCGKREHDVCLGG